MRFLVTLPLAAALTGATPPSEQPLTGMPGYEQPARPWADGAEAEARLKCRQTIEQVRDAAGQPELDKEPATSGEAQPYYAVDRKVDGCPVLVMTGDPADMRPVPQPETPKMQPER